MLVVVRAVGQRLAKQRLVVEADPESPLQLGERVLSLDRSRLRL
jgi:hypothetical protein